MQPNETMDRPFTILVVGPFQADVKNIATALMGIRLAKERLKVPVKLLRVSQIPLSDEERKIIEPDVYHFHVPHDEMGEIYREADLYISMSKEGEGFGLSAVEAMACGVPTILSRISSHEGFDESPDYSLFVEGPDPESVVHAIGEIFKDRPLREKIVHRGQIVANRFSEETLINRLNGCFESILRRHRSVNVQDIIQGGMFL